MIPAASIAKALQGHLLDGRYRLKSLLGDGGFGVVMKADHLLGSQVLAEVAVKLIPTREDLLSGQVGELRQSLQLNHSGLVRTLGVGQGTVRVGDVESDVVYLAMELGSETLESRLQTGLLGADEGRELTTQLAEVLDYLRTQRVLHRDIKPSNVLRVDGRWKLADLGIARTLDDGVTLDAPGTGTLFYMPPEALEGVASPSWDIWSLGVTVMEAVTRELPYPTRNHGEWRRLIRTQEPEIQLGLPAPIDQIVRACLSRDRGQRPTPQQILAQLRTTPAAIAILAPGAVVVASSGGHTASLEEAVRQAKPWTRIYLGPGRYECSLELNRAIEIIGVGAPADIVIDGMNRSALKVTASEGLIRGVTLQSSGPAPVDKAVVEVRSGGVVFELCEVRSSTMDCFFAYGRDSQPIARRSRFIGGKHNGLAFDSDAEGVVEHCVVTLSPRAGIVLSDRANPLIRRTSVQKPGFRAVTVSQNGRGVIEDSRLEGGTGPAVELFSGAETVFRRCAIVAGSGVAVHGHSGAKVTFIKCDLDAPSNRQRRLSGGHQVQRL